MYISYSQLNIVSVFCKKKYYFTMMCIFVVSKKKFLNSGHIAAESWLTQLKNLNYVVVLHFIWIEPWNRMLNDLQTKVIYLLTKQIKTLKQWGF